MLEAVKRVGGDPPVRKGAGYNGVYTATAGFLYFLPDKASALSGFFQFIFSCSAYDTEVFCWEFPLAEPHAIHYNV